MSICTHPPHLSPSAWRACLSLSSPKEANSLMEKKTQQIVCRKGRWSYSGTWAYILAEAIFTQLSAILENKRHIWEKGI